MKRRKEPGVILVGLYGFGHQCLLMARILHPPHQESAERYTSLLWKVLVVSDTNCRQSRLGLFQDALPHGALFEQPRLQRRERAKTGRRASLMIGQLQRGVRSSRQRPRQREHRDDAADISPPPRQIGGRPASRRLGGPCGQTAATERIACQRGRHRAADQAEEQQHHARAPVATTRTAHLLNRALDLFAHPIAIALKRIVSSLHIRPPRSMVTLVEARTRYPRQPGSTLLSTCPAMPPPDPPPARISASADRCCSPTPARRPVTESGQPQLEKGMR